MLNKKKRHGYIALSRQAIFLKDQMGNRLFFLYCNLALIARWSRNDEYFGCVVGTQTEIAVLLNMSQSALSRNIKDIIKLNPQLLIKRAKYIRLAFYPLFTNDVASAMSSNDYENIQDLYSDMHLINVQMQNNYEIMQEKRAQNHRKRLYNSSSTLSNSFTDDSKED